MRSPRRSYEADNPLIGYPLAYQYLTSLRADAIPANADELLPDARPRLAGDLFDSASLTSAPGVPLVNAFRWDTGVQAHAATDLVEFTASVTTGTLSNPLFRDDNAGRQFAGRVALHPIAGLIVGASGAHGPFVSAEAARAAVGSEQDGAFAQTAWGGDVEYSRGYYVVRAETIVSRWTLPIIDNRLSDQRRDLGRRTLQDPSRVLRRRARRPSRLQPDRRRAPDSRPGMRRSRASRRAAAIPFSATC